MRDSGQCQWFRMSIMNREADYFRMKHTILYNDNYCGLQEEMNNPCQNLKNQLLCVFSNRCLTSDLEKNNIKEIKKSRCAISVDNAML